MARADIRERAQNAIAAVLRYGSMLSTLVMALGVALAMRRGGVGSPSEGPSTRGLIRSVIELEPMGIAELGILLLLLTPVLRVATAIVAFRIERDYKYVLISSGVLLVILASMLFALK
jgi:uncharacterized membrane protein